MGSTLSLLIYSSLSWQLGQVNTCIDHKLVKQCTLPFMYNVFWDRMVLHGVSMVGYTVCYTSCVLLLGLP